MNDGQSSDDNTPGYGDPVAPNWLSWFTTLEGHQYMVQIEEKYIRDPSNLVSLQQEINFTKEKFKKCLELILSERPPNEVELQDQ